MNNIKSFAVAAFATTAIAFSAVPVLASSYVIDAQGGTWNYGVGSKYVWSYYSHNSKTHKASVEGKYYVTSGWIKAKTQARASAAKAAAGNQSYYDVK